MSLTSCGVSPNVGLDQSAYDVQDNNRDGAIDCTEFSTGMMDGTVQCDSFRRQGEACIPWESDAVGIVTARGSASASQVNLLD